MVVDLSEIVPGFVCLSRTIYQQKMAMAQEEMHAGSSKKYLLLESTDTDLEYQLNIAGWFLLHGVPGVWLYWSAARDNIQMAGSSPWPGDQVHSPFCALQMPHFWLYVLAEFLFFWRRKLWVCGLLNFKLGKFSAEITVDTVAPLPNEIQ